MPNTRRPQLQPKKVEREERSREEWKIGKQIVRLRKRKQERKRKKLRRSLRVKPTLARGSGYCQFPA